MYNLLIYRDWNKKFHISYGKFPLRHPIMSEYTILHSCFLYCFSVWNEDYPMPTLFAVAYFLIFTSTCPAETLNTAILSSLLAFSLLIRNHILFMRPPTMSISTVEVFLGAGMQIYPSMYMYMRRATQFTRLVQ